MKKSELKEAIKNEITSVLSEEIQVGDIVTLGGDGDELEVIDSREMFGSDMMAHRVKFPNGDTAEYSADQLRPARMMNEGKKGVVVDPDEIMMHINQYQSGNIDGDDLAQAIEEILVAMMNKSVSFSDIREGTWSLGKASDINIILSQLQDLSKKAYNIIGDDEFYNGIDAAITRAEELMMNAPLNEEKEEDDDDKAASKSAKKEKLGKQASKLSQADEDRYERIKNGLEKLKKKGDEESIKKMKAILGKKEVEELIKAKGRTKASFM
jgi:hypothetical protein